MQAVLHKMSAGFVEPSGTVGESSTATASKAEGLYEFAELRATRSKHRPRFCYVYLNDITE